MNSQHHNCPICLEDVEKTYTSPCAHVFCTKCFENWQRSCRDSKKCLSCPLCRTTIADTGPDASQELIDGFHSLAIDDSQVYSQHDEDEPPYYFDPYLEEYVYSTQEPEDDPDSELNGYF